MLMRPPLIHELSLSQDSQAPDSYNQVAAKLKSKPKQTSLSFRNNESIGQFIRHEPDAISIVSSGSKGTKHKKVKQSSLGKINLAQESQDNQPFEEDNRSVNSIGSRNSQKRKPKESSLGKPKQNAFPSANFVHPSNKYDDERIDSPKANEPLFHLATDFMFEKPQVPKKTIGSPRLVGYGRLGDQAASSSKRISNEEVINKDSDDDKPILRIQERSIDLKKHPVLLPYLKATLAPVERLIERVEPTKPVQQAQTLKTNSIVPGSKMVDTKMNETNLRRLDVFGRMKGENSVSRLSQQKDNISRLSNEEKPKSRSKLGELLRESRENEQKTSVMSNNFHVLDSAQILVSTNTYRPISPFKGTKPVEQYVPPSQTQPLFSPPSGAMKYKETPLVHRPTVGVSMKPLEEKILTSDNEYFEADESNGDFNLSMSHDPKASVNFCFENQRRTKGIYVASNFMKSTDKKTAENYTLPKTEDELKIIQKLKENEDFIKNSGVLQLPSTPSQDPYYHQRARPQLKQQTVPKLEEKPMMKIDLGQKQMKKISLQAETPLLPTVEDQVNSAIFQLEDEPEVLNAPEERRRRVQKPPMIKKLRQRKSGEEPIEKQRSSGDEKERQLQKEKQQRKEEEEKQRFLRKIEEQKRKQLEEQTLQEAQQKRNKQLQRRSAERRKNEEELKEKYNIEVKVEKNAKRQQQEAQRKDRLIQVQSSYSRDSDVSRSNSGSQRRIKESTVKIAKVAKVRLMDQGPHQQESYFQPEPQDRKLEHQEYEPSQQKQSQYEKFDEERVHVKSKTDINFYDYSNSQRDLKPPSSKPPLSKKSTIVSSKSKSKPKESTLNIRNTSILPNKSTISKHEETGKKISLVERALAKAYDGSEGEDYSQGSFRSSIQSKNSRNSRNPKKEPSRGMMKSNQKVQSQNSSSIHAANLRQHQRTIISKNCTFINDKGNLVTQDLVIKGGKAYGVPSRAQNDDQLHTSLLQRSRERRQRRSRSRSRDSKKKLNPSRPEQQFKTTICQDFYEQHQGEQIFATQNSAFSGIQFTTNALKEFIKPVEQGLQQRTAMNQTANPGTWKADQYYQSAVGPKKNVASKRTMPRMERSRKKA